MVQSGAHHQSIVWGTSCTPQEFHVLWLSVTTRNGHYPYRGHRDSRRPSPAGLGPIEVMLFTLCSMVISTMIDISKRVTLAGKLLPDEEF